MQISTLSADPHAIRIVSFSSDLDSITIVAQTSRLFGECPKCQTPSSSLHSYYVRQLTDLPWHGVAIRLQLNTRKFRCRNELCQRKIFCERLPKVVESYGRKTVRLQELFGVLAFVLGGEAGSKTAREFGLNVSGDTLLRRIRRISRPTVESVKVLGVDDFSFRRGIRFGTILVDLEKRKPIDLLPDRESETLALWLKQHPEIEIISRDRAGAYAEGSRTGAPHAKQVSDRWHLLKNLGEAIERALQNQSQAITKAAEIVRQKQICSSKCFIKAGVGTMLSSRSKTLLFSGTDNLQLKRFRQVHQLFENGTSINKIGKRLKMSRMTVYRYLRFQEFPTRAKAKERGSRLEPYFNYLHQRFAQGCQNATQLWREVVEKGYQGKPAMVRRYIRNLRRRISQIESKDIKNKEIENGFAAPSVRQTAILLLKKVETLKEEEKIFVETLVSSNQNVQKISQLGLEFQKMIREKQSQRFPTWLEESAKCGIKEIAGFAWGLKQDQQAVTESMKSEWSNGQVEGQVNRLKLIKRQMYGRASFDLLKARVLHQF
jgi:transposase